MKKRSRAFQKALELSGGFTPGKGAPSLPRSYTPKSPTYFSPVNGRPATQPVPKGSFTRDTLGRVGSALKTEFFGRANQVYRFAKKGFEDATKANIRPRITLKMDARMSSSKKPKALPGTIPLIDNETSIGTTFRGRPKMDKTMTTTTMKMDMSGPVKQRSFRTIFKVGKPTSKSIYQAAKLNGTKTKMLFSTLTDPNFKDPTTQYKEYNEIVTGFNQKIFYSSKYLTPSWKSIYQDIYKITLNPGQDAGAPNPDSFDRSQYISLYGCATKVTSSITLRNNMNTTSAVVKVHLVALKDPQYGSHFWFKPISDIAPFSTGVTLQGVETERCYTTARDYPRPYARLNDVYSGGAIQFAPDTTNTHAYYTSVVPSVVPQESKTFNDTYTIVKTFVKTLDVGDDWTINLQRSLGSGLKLDEALRAYSAFQFNAISSEDNPFGHRIIVEVVGKPITAEAAYTDPYTGVSGQVAAYSQATTTGQDKYIGTAPCSVSYEASHYVNYVLQSYSGVPGEAGISSTLNETDFAKRIGGPLIRSFVTDKTTISKPFNMDYWKMNYLPLYYSPLVIKSATTATVQTITTTT